MDSLLRNLERQYQANPADTETMKRLLAAYRRLHHAETADVSESPALTEDRITDALTESGLGTHCNITYRDGQNSYSPSEKDYIFWEIEYQWSAEASLDELNHFADILGLSPENISLSGGYEDVTRCSCGGCSRDIEERFNIVIRLPRKEKDNAATG